MANHLDVVPVRTNDESCIVARVVLRAQTRRTVVFAARVQSRTIESVDLPPILGRERQVKLRRLLLGLIQAQGDRALWAAKLDTIGRRPLRDDSYAERFERLEEEGFARRIVADSEFDVIKHEVSWLAHSAPATNESELRAQTITPSLAADAAFCARRAQVWW